MRKLHFSTWENKSSCGIHSIIVNDPFLLKKNDINEFVGEDENKYSPLSREQSVSVLLLMLHEVSIFGSMCLLVGTVAEYGSASLNTGNHLLRKLWAGRSVLTFHPCHWV